MIKYAVTHDNAPSQGTKVTSDKVVHTARGYPSLSSNKWLGVIPPPPNTLPRGVLTSLAIIGLLCTVA